jgi:hypothetical protein
MRSSASSEQIPQTVSRATWVALGVDVIEHSVVFIDDRKRGRVRLDRRRRARVREPQGNAGFPDSASDQSAGRVECPDCSEGRQYDQLANATLTTSLIQAIFAATVKSPDPTETASLLQLPRGV